MSRGEPILAVSTDKVEMEVESFANGYLRQWLAEEGTLASAMSPVAIVTDTAEEAYVAPGDESKPEQVAAENKPAATPSVKSGARGVTAVPAARNLAKERGIDLSKVQGTGPDGLITKADVQRWAERSQVGTSSASVSLDSRALSAMAATVVASKRDIPHFYATVDVAMSHAAAWRTWWNQAHPDLHATYNDLFVLCAARALRDVPRLNVSYSNGTYKQQSAANVLLVVAQEPTMLLVPVSDPAGLSWDVFLQAMRKARLGASISAEPLLAISNLGMFGVKQFAAIIPPQCTAALAIGAVREQPAIKNGKLENEIVCSLTISADHRVVDGLAAARFLERVQFHLNSL